MDTPDRWARLDDLFERALALPAADRAAFLARETPDDPGLRAEAQSLLDAAGSAEGFFSGLARDIAPPGALAPGSAAGPYRITGTLGEGGMGTVYRAERADGQFERAVALKVFRGGDPRRFLAERRILARLSHPGIAQLYDGGVLPDGRPFFAMELVEGEPITDYAARRGLDVDARLALFQQVCEAVQYAHAHLVVHRDLKPSNILVTSGHEARATGESSPRSLAPSPQSPRIKLLDFGIAKLVGDAEAALTQSGAAPLTPAYAAPEQVRGEAVTTATDVYALGVLLYELLTGRRPYRLPDRARAAVERAILETEPTRPSEAVTAPADDATATLPAPPARLARRLQGDLDQIVLKALRKEPEARYGSAEAFARDVRRHRDGLPVEARPASAAYRLRRLVRRHRAASLAALLVALALVGGAAVALWQAAEATRARDRAESTAAEAEVVTEFLLAVLGEADADVSAQRLSVAEARAVVDAARERLDAGALEGQPAARVRLAWTLGRLYLEIGADSVALGLLTDALASARATHGEVHETTAGIWLRLGHLYNTRADSAAARRAYDAALRAAPADARQARAQALIWGATVLPAGHPQREARFQRARALAAALPDTTLALVDVLNTFGQKLHDDPARAADLFREALAIADRLGDRGYQIGLLNNLGLSLEYAAPAEALRHLRRARALGVAHLGPRHPEVGTMTTNLGAVLFEQGAHAEAVALLEEAVEIEREARSETSLQVAIALSWLGRARLAAGDARDAADALDEALRLFDAASFDPAHPRIVELRAARAEARRRA